MSARRGRDAKPDPVNIVQLSIAVPVPMVNPEDVSATVNAARSENAEEAIAQRQAAVL